MNRLIVTGLLCAALWACGDMTVRPEPKVVQVAVPVHVDPPKAEKIERPFLPINTLTKDSSDEKVAEAYVKTVKILTGYAEMLEAACEPFMIKDEPK